MKKIIFYSLFAVYLIFPSISTAQIINVQNYMIKKVPKGFATDIGGNGDFRSGNLDYNKYSGSLGVMYVYGAHTLLLLGNGDYAEKTGDSFIHKYREHLRYRYKIFDHLNIETFIQHEMVKFKRLSLRALAGVGPTSLLFESKRLLLHAGSMYMFELNQLSKSDSENIYVDSGEEVENHRWNNFFTIKMQLCKGIKFLHTVYYQPDFTDFSNFRLLLDTGFSFAVKKWLSFTLTHTFAYQSNAPDSLEKGDHVFKMGLTLSYSNRKSK
jgi:Protein of unknown function, DUF481